MESSDHSVLPSEIIGNEEKTERYTIGSTTIEYSLTQLRRHFQQHAEETLSPEQAEKLATHTTLYFDLLSYYKHVFQHSPFPKDRLKIGNATHLLAWNNLKNSFMTLSDIVHATELVFPNAENPAILINMRKIENDLSSFGNAESRPAAFKAVLGEYWNSGCRQIIELQNPQKKVLGSIQKVAKKTGIGTGVGAINFASGVLPFPYSIALGPVVNIAANLINREKTHPVSNSGSKLFEVHCDQKAPQYTPLPPFLSLD